MLFAFRFTPLALRRGAAVSADDFTGVEAMFVVAGGAPSAPRWWLDLLFSIVSLSGCFCLVCQRLPKSDIF